MIFWRLNERYEIVRMDEATKAHASQWRRVYTGMYRESRRADRSSANAWLARQIRAERRNYENGTFWRT